MQNRFVRNKISPILLRTIPNFIAYKFYYVQISPILLSLNIFRFAFNTKKNNNVRYCSFVYSVEMEEGQTFSIPSDPRLVLIGVIYNQQS